MKRAAVPPESKLHCTRCRMTIQAGNLLSHRQERDTQNMTECDRVRAIKRAQIDLEIASAGER